MRARSVTLSMTVARQVLEAQPFSRLVKAELTRFSAEGTELRVPITESLKQQRGIVHGGIVSYAADNALTFAGGFALGPAVVTSEYKINYLLPAVGDVLVARAQVLHAGKRQAVCRCEVFTATGGGETLCAVAQGTIAILPRTSGAAA